MGVAVNVEKLRGIDLRVNLGGRQAGMAKKLLQRPQVRPTGEQMRREAVPQSVWGQAIRQPKPLPG